MADTTRVNGNQISWSSFKFKLEGVPYSGITGVDYNDGRERAYAYGTGRHHAPRGRTAGKYVPEPLVITCWESTAKAILEDLKARSSNGRSFGSVESTAILQYVEPSDAVITVEAQQCVLVKIETSHEETTEGLASKLTFMPMRYVRDGGTLYEEA